MMMLERKLGWLLVTAGNQIVILALADQGVMPIEFNAGLSIQNICNLRNL